MDNDGDPGEEGGEGRDGAPRHLPRRGGPQGHRQTVEGLRPRHQSRLGPDGTERPAAMWSLWGGSSTRAAGSSEAWRKEHTDEFADEEIGAPEKMETSEERRERLRLNQVPEGAVCGLRARHLHTAPG